MVAVRCRPFNRRELDQQESKIVTIGSDGYCGLQPADESDRMREFSFDFTYDDGTLQRTVYENLGQPMLDKAFDGWNGTIFAYGQTGSGKSFSMTGSKENPGIIPQLNDEMFQRIVTSQAENPAKKFLVTCSFMEIYNEVLYDLLDPSIGKGASKSRKDSNIEIKEHPALGVYVQGLQEIAVDSHVKIEQLMTQGNDMRAVAATNMNATSSRSHSIFIIKITQKEAIAGQQKEVRATINLVDLAGSERVSKTGATGDKLKEGANINKSLSALGNVINALAEQSKKNKKVFIPYRNSKLTRVLQESLGGNSVTVMLAAISPAAYNFEETLNTLQYADRAKAIQLKARKNEQMTEVGKLKAEIEALKAQLASSGGGGSGGGGDLSEAAKAQMQSQIEDYNLMLKQSFEEKERLAQAMEKERRELLEKQDATRAELQRKYEAERRAMLEADSDHWVRMLLQSSKHNPSHTEFVHSMESLEGRRRELAEKLREQSAFIAVLQNALEREATQYLEKEAALRAAGDDPHAGADEVAVKTLLEQMLIKMKNLREEMSKTYSVRDELATQLEALESGAAAQLRIVKNDEDEGVDLVQTQRERFDLELFVEFSATQRAKQRQKEGVLSTGLNEPLKAVTSAVQRGVEEELQTVSGRLASNDSIDATTRANMEKRVTVLEKELSVLADIVQRDDLGKVLHGLSQVVQGVVTRTSKRLSMRDKKKGEALAAKEQQVKEMRAEAEQMREKQYKENIALNDEVARLLKENGELQTMIVERDHCISRFQVAARKMGQDNASVRAALADIVVPTAFTATLQENGQTELVPNASSQSVDSPKPRAMRAPPPAPAGELATAPRRPASAGSANPFRVDVASLVSGADGPASAALQGKLQILDGQLKETQQHLRQAVEVATRVQEEKRYIEETELISLRMRAAKLEEELMRLDPEVAAKVNEEQPSVPPLPLGNTPLVPLSLNVIAAAPQTVSMTVPEGAAAGAELTVTAPNGEQVTITVPEGVQPGEQLEVQMPGSTGSQATASAQALSMTVPEGATAGTEVTVTAPNGQQVTFSVPEGVEPGQQIEVQLPSSNPAAAATIAPLRLTVETRSPTERETEYSQIRSLHNEKMTLTLQLASTAQEATGAHGREAELELQVAQLREERDAYARQLQGSAAEVHEDVALEAADGQGKVETLQAQLRAVQNKAVEATQSSREEKLKAERARMEAELGITQLKEERLQLQETVLTAEEAALEAQQELENERQAVLELKEVLMKSELRTEQLEQKLKLVESSTSERIEKLQAEVEDAEARATEAHDELEALEEEKYSLVHDIEVLEEELEDANTHQKRYYEALMQKEDQLNRLKAQCAALTKAVEKLQYENELNELRNNPVGEELDVAHLHQETDELKRMNASKDRELQKLKTELEAMQLTVEEESYDQQSPGKLKSWLDGSNENVPAINFMEPLTPLHGEDAYSKVARAREEMEAKAAAAAEAEKQRAAAAAQQLEENEHLMRIQLQQEKERVEQGISRIRQLEAQSHKQERELLGLIAARDELISLQSKKDEELNEMQDNLYDASQKLEEEQDRSAELQTELDELRKQLQEMQKSLVGLRSLEMELEDERQARKKLEQRLKQALG